MDGDQSPCFQGIQRPVLISGQHDNPHISRWLSVHSAEVERQTWTCRCRILGRRWHGARLVGWSSWWIVHRPLRSKRKSGHVRVLHESSKALTIEAFCPATSGSKGPPLQIVLSELGGRFLAVDHLEILI